MTDLPNGPHNVTVYTTNEFGYIGASKTIFFNVDAPESFPVVPAITISVAVVGSVLLVCLKKSKR